MHAVDFHIAESLIARRSRNGKIATDIPYLFGYIITEITRIYCSDLLYAPGRAEYVAKFAFIWVTRSEA